MMGLFKEIHATNRNILLVCIPTYMRMTGKAPSVNEIRNMTGLHSARYVRRCVRRLKSEGYLTEYSLGEYPLRQTAKRAI